LLEGVGIEELGRTKKANQKWFAKTTKEKKGGQLPEK